MELLVGWQVYMEAACIRALTETCCTRTCGSADSRCVVARAVLQLAFPFRMTPAVERL